MASVTRVAIFLFVTLHSWLLPQQAAALPQSIAHFPTAFLDAGEPSAFSTLSSTLLADRPINGTIFWLGSFFGSCSDGAAAVGTGCSLTPNSFSPALVGFFIDDVEIGAIGNAISFSGAGPNNFSVGPVAGSFNCDLVTGCDRLDIRLSFIGSGGGDSYNNLGIILSLRDTPFVVPEPASLALVALSFGVFGFVRRHKK